MTLPANALMTTQGTYTGQNMGANRLDRVKTDVKQTFLISEIMPVLGYGTHQTPPSVMEMRGRSASPAGNPASPGRSFLSPQGSDKNL